MSNPFNVYKVKKAKRNSCGSPLHESYHIRPKPEPIENDIYLVLRPDKDNVANKLFPDQTVVYLRYDKPDDLLTINKYFEMKKATI